jgi:WD40 repeat protein
MKYNAFISYSHSADSNLAPSIEAGLEKFAKPIFKRRALRIFRDSNDLSASPNLWANISEGLSNAEYFIFFASPQAAKSKWCRKEVEYWKKNKSIDKFLIVLTEGNLAWDEFNHDFDWNKTNCLPNNLAGVFEDEPLHVDFKEHPETLSLKNPDFLNKIVLLAATLHGRTIDDMVGEGVSQHKKTIRIRNSAITILCLMLVTSIFLAFLAFQQKQTAETNEQLALDNKKEAIKQKNLAIHQANRALAKSYLSDSKANATIDPTLSFKLATYAYQFAKMEELDLMEFEDHIISTYYKRDNYYLLNDEDFVFETDSIPMILEADNMKLEMLTRDTLTLTDKPGNRKTFHIDYFENEGFYSFSKLGKFIITKFDIAGANDFGTKKTLFILDLDLNIIAKALTPIKWQEENKVKFDDLESRFIISSATEVNLYGFRTGSIQHLQIYNNTNDYSPEIQDVVISNDGNLVAFSRIGGNIDVLRLNPNELKIIEQWQLKGHRKENVDSIAFNKDGKYLFSKSKNFTRKWNTFNQAIPRHIQLNSEPISENSTIFLTTDKQGMVDLNQREDEIRSITYFNNNGDTLSTFSKLTQPTRDNDSYLVSNDRYKVSREGLFNNRNEQLVPINETRTYSRWKVYAIGLSTDNKFLFVIDKIYPIDVKYILTKVNDSNSIGSFSSFDSLEKEMYMIQDFELLQTEIDSIE